MLRALILAAFAAVAWSGDAQPVAPMPTFEVREVLAVYGDLAVPRPGGRAWAADYSRFDRFPSSRSGDKRCAFVVEEGAVAFAPDVPHGEGDRLFADHGAPQPPAAVFHLGPPLLTLADVVDVSVVTYAGAEALRVDLTVDGGARNKAATTRVHEEGGRGATTGRLAIVVDGAVVSDPLITFPSGESFIVSGRMDAAEVQRLAAAVRKRRATERDAAVP